MKMDKLTPILAGVLAGLSFWVGQVYQTNVIERHTRRIYQIFTEKTKDRDDELINIGVKAVYELLFKRKPPT